MDYIWVENDQDIRKIVNEGMKVHIKWTMNPKIDYLELSRQYMNAGYETLKEIIVVPHNNNVKYDMWFLPGAYMLRQAIELLVKAGLAIKGTTKPELQIIFLTYKHNIKELYNAYKERYGVDALSEVEQVWLEAYIDSVEVIDANSELFRYPFKDVFMEQYGDKALDICHMGNRLIYCYTTLNKMIFGGWYDEELLDLEEEPSFISLANSGMHNCYLWNSPWDSGFHKQITGYSEVARCLFDKFKVSRDERLFYPIVFLMRNAIEMGLKRLLHMRVEQKVDDKVISGKRNSHKLYKDLWKSVKTMLQHYSEEDNQDESTLDLVEAYIIVVDDIDKQGDVFRYPSSYSHEYKFNGEEIDVENFFQYLLALFHAVDSFDSWLEHIKEVEMEMRSEWEAEMRSNMDYYGYDY